MLKNSFATHLDRRFGYIMINQSSGRVHVKAVWLPHTVICPEEFLSDADSGFPEPVPISRCNVHFWKHKQRRFLGHQSVKHYLKSLAAKLALPLHLIEIEGLRLNLLKLIFFSRETLGSHHFYLYCIIDLDGPRPAADASCLTF